MQKQQRAIVIQSPHAGRAMLLSQALTLLEQAGAEVARVLSIAALDSLPPQGALWQEQGMTLAIAAGGDGVVGGVITHLAAGRLSLGILPLGVAPPTLPSTGFVIYERQDDPLVLIETLTDELLFGEERAVSAYRDAFARMLATAVTGTAAHELIRDAMSR